MAAPAHDSDFFIKRQASIWVLASLSGFLAALRLYCKLLTKRRLWWDDYLLVLAWLLLLAATITSAINMFLDRRQPTLPGSPYDYEGHQLGHGLRLPHPLNPLLSNFAASFAILAACSSKTSFAVTILRLTTEWYRLFVWFIIASLTIFQGLTAIFTWVRCVPPGKTERCMRQEAYIGYSLFSGAFSGAMDLVLAFLPWHLIWGLRMDVREKLGIVVAMSLGVFASITTVMKCIAIPAMGEKSLIHSGVDLIVWGNAEVATTIMAASIPALRVLIRDATAGSSPSASSGTRPPPGEPGSSFRQWRASRIDPHALDTITSLRGNKIRGVDGPSRSRVREGRLDPAPGWEGADGESGKGILTLAVEGCPSAAGTSVADLERGWAPGENSSISLASRDDGKGNRGNGGNGYEMRPWRPGGDETIS